MCRCWGCQVLAGGCTRSLLVLHSTEHQPLHGVGMIPEQDHLSLGGQPEGNWKSRVCPENHGGAEVGLQRDAGPEWRSLRMDDAPGRPQALRGTVARPSSQGWEWRGRTEQASTGLMLFCFSLV